MKRCFKQMSLCIIIAIVVLGCIPWVVNAQSSYVYTTSLTINVFYPPSGQAMQIANINGRYCIGIEILATLSDQSTTDVTFDVVFASTLYVNNNYDDGELIITVSYDGLTETYIWSYRDNATWVIRFVVGRRSVSSGCRTIRGIVAPVISDGRVLVPLRIVSEVFGAEVEWNATTRTVIITYNEIYLHLPIDVPLPDGMGTPIIINGRTMVPLRFISEAFGAEVEWDPVNRAAYIFP